MQIVINIDNNLYTRLFDNGVTDAADMLKACIAIRKGTVLPKNHGRLIDASRLKERIPLIVYYSESSVQQMIDSVPIVLDAEAENDD